MSQHEQPSDPADEAIRHAIVAAGPVPAGLDQRILAALSQARAAKLPPTPAPEISPLAATAAANTDAEKPASTWTWRVPAGLALAASLLLGLGIAIWQFQPSTLTKDQILATAMEWPNVKQLTTNPWYDVDAQTQSTHPYPYTLLSAKPSAWQACSSSEIGARGVVYRLKSGGPGPGIKRGYLFVLHAGRDVTGLGTAPLPQPLRSTGGWSLAAWRQDDLVFVLLAEGSGQSFRQLLRNAPVAA